MGRIIYGGSDKRMFLFLPPFSLRNTESFRIFRTLGDAVIVFLVFFSWAVFICTSDLWACSKWSGLWFDS